MSMFSQAGIRGLLLTAALGAGAFLATSGAAPAQHSQCNPAIHTCL